MGSMENRSESIEFSGAQRRAQARDRKGSARIRVYFVTTIILLAVAFVAGIAIGSSKIAASSVAKVLLSHFLPNEWVDLSGVSEADQVIVWFVRTPRVLLAGFVGASLAVAGAQLQGLFRNALASPDVIGSSSGGAFGAVLALSTGLAMRSLFYLPMMSFIGALVALFIAYAIATRRGRTPVATLLLAGVALNAMVGAATSFLISLKWVRWEVAQEILFWLMGGLDSRTWQHVWLAAPCCVIGMAIAFIYARDLDVLVLGEEAALAVGADVEKVKRVIITGTALLTGGAVAVSGIIGFVGLVVPHIVRLLIGPRHRNLLPASALTGAAFLILTDIIARTIQRPEEIRLGIITAVFGAPFFLYLLLRHHRSVGIG
jgi:iron complex transport system permease protein